MINLKKYFYFKFVKLNNERKKKLNSLMEKQIDLKEEIIRLDESLKTNRIEKSSLEEEKRNLIFSLEDIFIKEKKLINEEKILTTAQNKSFFKMLKLSLKINIQKNKTDLKTFYREPNLDKETLNNLSKFEICLK